MNEFTLDDFVDIIAVPITEERPWVVFGACREADSDFFFPTSREEERQAIAICATCPVRVQCLEYSLEARERFGIWGGMTEKQRRRLLKRSA